VSNLEQDRKLIMKAPQAIRTIASLLLLMAATATAAKSFRGVKEEGERHLGISDLEDFQEEDVEFDLFDLTSGKKGDHGEDDYGDGYNSEDVGDDETADVSGDGSNGMGSNDLGDDDDDDSGVRGGKKIAYIHYAKKGCAHLAEGKKAGAFTSFSKKGGSNGLASKKGYHVEYEISDDEEEAERFFGDDDDDNGSAAKKASPYGKKSEVHGKKGGGEGKAGRQCREGDEDDDDGDDEDASNDDSPAPSIQTNGPAPTQLPSLGSPPPTITLAPTKYPTWEPTATDEPSNSNPPVSIPSSPPIPSPVAPPVLLPTSQPVLLPTLTLLPTPPVSSPSGPPVPAPIAPTTGFQCDFAKMLSFKCGNSIFICEDADQLVSSDTINGGVCAQQPSQNPEYVWIDPLSQQNVAFCETFTAGSLGGKPNPVILPRRLQQLCILSFYIFFTSITAPDFIPPPICYCAHMRKAVETGVSMQAQCFDSGVQVLTSPHTQIHYRVSALAFQRRSNVLLALMGEIMQSATMPATFQLEVPS
jgi:hypothetical protein